MFLYFISDTKNIKIGITKDVDSRIKSLQTGNPNKLELYRMVEIPDNRALQIESNLHQYFDQYRLCGEWFDIECKVIIDKLSDEDIRNISIINEEENAKDGIYIYQIIDTEYANCILKKHRIIYTDDGFAKYKDKRKHSKYDPTLEDIILNINENKENIFTNRTNSSYYTFDKNKAIEMVQNVVYRQIEYVKSKIESHYKSIDKLMVEVEQLQGIIDGKVKV